MGLRGRLALFFVAITVVPLMVALVALQVQVSRQIRQLTAGELAAVRASAEAVLSLVRERAGDVASDLAPQEGAGARELAGVLMDADPETAQAWLEAQVQQLPADRTDIVILADADGTPLASVVDEAAFAPGFEAPTVEELIAAAANETVPPGVLLEVREVRGQVGDSPPRRFGWVLAGVWLDETLLRELVRVGGVGLVAEDQVLAAVGAAHEQVPIEDLPSPGEVIEARLDEPALVTTASLPAPSEAELLLWTPVPRAPVFAFLLLLFLPSVAVAAGLGWLLAGGIVAPVERAAEVARAVAAGDLDRQLAPTGGRELEDLATSLNTMSAELAARLDELERSRDELRGSLSRLGETLSSSLDLNRTLSVVVETAMDTLGADRAALLLFTPERDALYPKVGRGIGEDPPRLRVGEGLIGWVAATGTAVRLPADAETAPGRIAGEPAAAQQLAVPMMARGRVIGVLTLLRNDPEPEFSQRDLDTIRSFATQASVAIENVMLHREAQRLSVTDTLTGLWNFRYFQLQAERELQSAARFERPLTLLIVDIDHFKPINDQYGHQVGDHVLAAVAHRIRNSTRVPDVVARYGGEEFVVLLPGTDLAGGVVTAERIREGVGGSPIVVPADDDERAIVVTCSVGVAAFPEHGASVAALLRSADAAMYTAKSRGRNRVVSAAAAGVLVLGDEEGDT